MTSRSVRAFAGAIAGLMASVCAGAFAQPTDAELRAIAATFPEMPRGTAGLVPFVDGLPTFSSGTPIDDSSYTLLDTDYIDGENGGYDVFMPVDPADPFPGSDRVNVVRCALNTDLDLAYGSARGDRIILGTDEIPHPFFLAGADGIDNDYAVVLHFDYAFGHIQLRGDASDYRLIYCTLADGCDTEGWYLFYTEGDTPDLIAFVFPCDFIEPSISGNPPNNPDPYCAGDGTLSLTNPAQFRYAQPVDPTPTNPQALAQFGGAGKEIVGGMTIDDQGNTYVLGATDSNLDNGTDAPHELFIARINADGTTAWITEIPAEEGALLWDAAADDEHLYVCGRTLGSLPGFTNAGRWDGILFKLRLSDGQVVATDQWGNQGIDGYGNIALDGAGGLFISGQGSPPGPATNDDAYLVAKHRTSDLGNVWRVVDPVPVAGFAASAEAWGGLTFDPATGPGTAPGEGRIVVGGWYFSASGADAFVAVYSDLTASAPTRDAFATIRSNGTRAEWVYDSAVDDQGRIYVAGHTTGSLQGPPAGGGDAYVMRFDPDLTNPVVRQFGSPANDVARSIAIDADGAVIVTGFTHGDLSGANASTGVPSADVFVQRFDQDLNPLNAIQFGSPLEDKGYAELLGDTLHIAGMTEGSLASASLGTFDGFVATLDRVSLAFNTPDAPCSPADLAEPFGLINFFDINAYLSAYNAGGPAADFAEPFGSLNFFDIAEFLAIYNQGCP